MPALPKDYLRFRRKNFVPTEILGPIGVSQSGLYLAFYPRLSALIRGLSFSVFRPLLTEHCPLKTPPQAAWAHYPIPRRTRVVFLRSVSEILETLRDYYAQPAVRARMLEFLGADGEGDFSCEYITADGLSPAKREPLLPYELFGQLDRGMDICRSLADRDSMIAHLDIEYVNFDFPADAYLDPARAFALEEPLEMAVKRMLTHYGIEPLHILSGRGHHFVWRIDRASRVFTRLASIGCRTLLHDSLLLRRRDGLDAPLITSAFAGLGLVMEFAARLAMDLAGPDTMIPIEMTAVEVAPSRRGRELISIDLSEYADPLPMRTIRVAFSGYLKPWQQVQATGASNLPRIGPILFVTLNGADLRDGLKAMRDTGLAAEWARGSSAIIPDQTTGTEHLMHHYLGSGLRKFHEYFLSAHHDDPHRWPETYDHTPLHDLPGGARDALRHPNDLLLRPVGMKSVTKALMQRGWHPRHAAGLIRSKFERDYGWGEEWKDYSPALRADYYTRIFAGEDTSVGTEAAEIRDAESHTRTRWREPALANAVET